VASGLIGRIEHPLVLLAGTVGLTLPWVLLHATGASAGLAPLTQVLLSGLAVLGASFLLAWGAETAEKDVPRAFAIAVLAVVAVAPEYAVDALYAWQAGAQAGTSAGAESGNLAVANMTGANRILIGLGWSAITLYALYRAHRATDGPAVEEADGALANYVNLDRGISLEILVLLLATAYAFLVPLNGGIDAVDTAVLVGLYLAYIAVVIRGDVEDHESTVGVPRYLQDQPRAIRVPAAVGLFAYSGAVIFVAVEPFAHGLEDLGLALGIPKFFMIQWLAPLASESPELIVTAYLVNKARTTAAFNTLISSKLNQWTLLIGTLSVVYSVALGQYGVLGFDAKQSAEIWITAAQSLFAIALLVDFRLSGREAVALLGLFVTQVVAEFVLVRAVAEPAATVWSIRLLYAYTAVYLAAGVGLIVRDRRHVGTVLRRSLRTVREAWGGSSDAGGD
jgi:cation:H+ antiporter